MRQKQQDLLWAVAGAALTMGVGLVWAGSLRQRSRAIASTSLPLGPVLNPMIIRVDAGGDGHYNSSRIGRVHQGTDVRCKDGQPVYAPFSGKVIREAVPYADDKRWRGIVIVSDAAKYECKLFYCYPGADIVGTTVERGQLIGYCQDISRKYTSGVTNHLHIEIRKGGLIMNPETVFAVGEIA